MTGFDKQLVGGLRREATRLFSVRRVDLELEVLPLPHIADGGVAKRVEGFGDGRALRDRKPTA